ncbi:MAG TPA: hypothetical protein VKY45_05255 [Marinilabiliaceae bacterium]|nr:hypothetical protein [Marinilabiliaceae bacterium]
MKPKLIISFAIYLLINSFFVIKYSSRLSQYNEYILTLSYVIMVLMLTFIYLKVNFNVYKTLFITAFLSFFAFTVYLNIAIDGDALNVDRWSAMQVAIKALLNGEYPYSAIDHLGGRTSNLPSLIFIGIPFYLVNNIGFLQSFAFLLFVFVVYITFSNYRDRLFCLLLLILSPAYLWEIYVKSDLMSNFIFILLFLVIVQNKISKKSKMNTAVLSFVTSALILTRLPSIIPISLLLFKKFYNYSLKNKTIFIITAFLTSAIFLFICFHNVHSFEHFKRHNPFELQNRQLPLFISFITILIPIIYSFRINNLKTLIKSSTFFLLLPVSISLTLSIIKNGFYNSVSLSYFDISYLNITLPFLLIYISFEYTKLFPNEKIIQQSSI